MSSDYDYFFKILLIGDSGVGKSSLLMRFFDSTFAENASATIGVDCKIRTIDINGKTIKVQVWDTAGQEKFRALTSSYYRGSMGIFVVYDIADESSFQSLNQWLSEVDKYASRQVNKMILGNKADLATRVISLEDGKVFAESQGIPFWETSAKTSQNVEEVFQEMVKAIKARVEKEPLASTKTITKLSLEREPQRKKCPC